MINITIDHRESNSKVAQLITSNNRFCHKFDSLSVADYLINGELCIERKSSPDFITSIISGRIFSQCAKMKKQALRNLVMIEGDPFSTDHDIHTNAIKGAIMSIAVSWEIPVILCRSPVEFVEYIELAANQHLDRSLVVKRGGYKPKRIRSRQLFFIQGIPGVGSGLAKVLLDHFKSISAIVNASQRDLTKVSGIGMKTAKQIVRFISLESRDY